MFSLRTRHRRGDVLPLETRKCAGLGISEIRRLKQLEGENRRLKQVVAVPTLDKAMLELEPINFHPLRNDRTIAVTAIDLLKFVTACGHVPQIVTLPEAA